MKQGTRLSVVVLALGCFAAAPLARASEPSPPAGGTEPERVRGLWLSLKLALPLSGGGWSAPLPRFLVGYHLGRVALGVEVGLGGGRSWAGGGTDPTYIESKELAVSLVPTVEVVMARRGPLALTLQSGLGVGYAWMKFPGAQYRGSSLMGVLQAALGARYHLHPRFALGAELGVAALYAWSTTTFEDTRTEVHSVRANPWAALTATVIW